MSGLYQLVLEYFEVGLCFEGVISKGVVFLVEQFQFSFQLFCFAFFFCLVDDVVEVGELGHPDDFFLQDHVFRLEGRDLLEFEFCCS